MSARIGRFVQCERTMGYIASKVFANHNMPCRAVPSIELLLDLGGDVFFDVVLFKGSGSDVDGFLLHFIAHVDVLYDGFGAGHSAGASVSGA
jgi:hypothetical protein